MNLEPTDDQRAVVDAFTKFLDTESSIARVRAALPSGFDPALWKGLGRQGALSLRAPERAGGLELGLLDAALIVEEAGRTLASGPLTETIVAARLLALLDPEDHAGLREAVAAGEAVLTLALHDAIEAPEQLVAGGAVADAVLVRRGEAVALVRTGGARAAEPTLASTPIARLRLDGEAEPLASGAEAASLFAAAVEEWKLLTAAALIGLTAEAVRLASAYACEREQFGRPIGAYQAISHPLAQHVVEVDAGRLMIWRAIGDVAAGAPGAAAAISTALWWAATAADKAVAQALHTFGGYGVTLEYDIHLFLLRAKAWPLVLGDPDLLLDEAAHRRFLGETASLPDVGASGVDFDPDDEQAEPLADEVRKFFAANLTPELRAKAHFSWAGHDPALYKKLGDAGLLFLSWPERMGGRGARRYAVEAAQAAWDETGWTTMPQGTSNMIGWIMDRFGTDQLKREVLAKVAAGEASCCLGFSEPGSGSDVFAARCKATFDGDAWRIDGQKMFTTGAEMADYVILLTRTDPEAAKHRGLTMFIVPLKAPGVTIQAVETVHDERTNITYYDGVRVPDAYRLGEVGGGATVMAAQLEIEHGSSFKRGHMKLLDAAERFCRKSARGGRPMIEDPRVLARLARTAANIAASDVLHLRALWAGEAGKPNQAFGPASKMFSSEVFRSDAADLLNLTAPESLSHADPDAAHINHCFRHSQITVTYGGTSEVHRSMIAERRLGLPRTR
jgi:alkylation response protein AidB-like acyl-CoA dehydrogenase